MKKNNIILTGFMGAGKGTLARQLQSRLNTLAIDTDDLVESFTNQSIKSIFESRGESSFRELEQKVVDWIIASVDNTIISTGGGMPIFAGRFEQMGRVYFLKADFDWIYNRLKNSPNAEKKFKKRPLFNDRSTAEKLMNERLPLYEQKADIVFDLSTHSEKEIIEQIISDHAAFVSHSK